MKRLTLNIDVDESKVFEKEVLQELQAYAKRVARDEAHKTVEEEIKRVVQDRVKDALKDTYEFRNRIRTMVNEYFEAHSDVVVSDLISEAVARAEKKTAYSIEQNCNKIIQGAIEKELANNLLKVLGQSIANSIKGV